MRISNYKRSERTIILKQHKIKSACNWSEIREHASVLIDFNFDTATSTQNAKVTLQAVNESIVSTYY